MLNPTENNELCWNSKDAWRCLVALVIADFLLVHWLREARHNYEFWLWSQTLQSSYFTMAVQGATFLGLTFYFARTKSIITFCRKTGFSCGITLFGWCGACLAIVVALLDEYGTHHGWTSASMRPSTTLNTAVNISGNEFFFKALQSVLLVPLYEEIVLRGFLYKAFRGSFGVISSTCLVVCFSGYLHWHSIISSVFTSVCFVMLWTLLCGVKERTGSLLNCLLCHAVFNAYGLHLRFSTFFFMLSIFSILIYLSWKNGVARDAKSSFQ